MHSANVTFVPSRNATLFLLTCTQIALISQHFHMWIVQIVYSDKIEVKQLKTRTCAFDRILMNNRHLLTDVQSQNPTIICKEYSEEYSLNSNIQQSLCSESTSFLFNYLLNLTKSFVKKPFSITSLNLNTI